MSDRVGFLEKRPGEKSMMRLAVLLGFIIGGVVTVWGMILLTRVINAIVNEGAADAVSVVGSLVMLIAGALTLMFGGEGFKALQQRGEMREMHHPNSEVH